ncbi:DUF3291 domain-containing protein [Hyphomonas sp. WL0036]|uniref:DUF3291 domain-containing protein n=1 Tax=Hyphomonas sediminis TaxID=2866160 RepID=UPI001C80A8EC|nr:DUF3291 domain-containing protein [Hyphomonas sediminis]MBY9066761.1 DUF3291 domain-containing protein [Hyphomonas sediminis]
MGFRLIHFNCVRPLGSFTLENPYVKTFLSILPRIFTDADQFDGVHFHNHGLRCPDGTWRSYGDAFPYPADWGSPHISTMAVWRSLEDLKQFTYSGRTHPPGMRRLAQEIDRSEGPGFVMWWAPEREHFTLEDGYQRLLHLRTHGSSDHAFSLENPVAQPAVA